MKNIIEKKPTFDLTRSGHALAAVGQEFPLELIRSDPRTALITLAFLFSNSNAMRCHSFGLATSQLAMFAAAPFASIDAKHYEELRKSVNSYRDYCLQLQKEMGQLSTQNQCRSIDQADGFAENRWQFDPQASGVATPSEYDHMIYLLTFVLSASERAYELEQVTRSVQKQLSTKNRSASTYNRGNVFEIVVPETSDQIRTEVVDLLETAGWAPEQLSESVFQVRGRCHAGFNSRRHRSNCGAVATLSRKILADGESVSQK